MNESRDPSFAWSDVAAPPARAAGRITQVVGRTVGFVAGVGGGVVLVLLPWLVAPLFGTARAGRHAGGWRRIKVRTRAPDSPSLRSGPVPIRSTRGRWQTRLVGVAAIGLVVGAGVVALSRTPGPPERPAYSLSRPEGVERTSPPVPAAQEGADWYPRYAEELEYAATWFDAIPLVDGAGLDDFRSTYMNVDGGYRRTWVPPACACPRISVWVYGASTVFGLGQRDDFTIPSQLARLAWRDGIALQVENRGIPSEQHWQEANRLRWDLTRYEPPDVVVFYDGASEISGAWWLDAQRLPDVPYPVEPMTEQFLADPRIAAAVAEAKHGDLEQPPVPDGLTTESPPTVEPRTPEEVGAMAVSRYERARRMSQDLAEIHDLQTFWFWQPTRFARGPIDGEPTTEFDADSRAAADTARSVLPDGVIDLTDVLQGSDQPVFTDDVHHNELGARLAAGGIYETLRPTVDRLVETRSDP